MFGSRKIMKGTLTPDRPWASTLAEIATAAHSGQLTVKSEGKTYQLAFAAGKLIGAVSPAAADAVQRIALTSRVMPAQSVAAAVRIMGRSDRVDKFTDAAGLTGDEALRFKQRVLVQRAARTFALERGDYVFEERITIPVLRDADIDVRAAIYLGMRMHVLEHRLASDLRAHGAAFILYPEHAQHVEAFGFDAEAEPILAALRGGTSVPELEALHRDLDSRLILAVLGSLAVCKVTAAIEPRRIAMSTQDISIGRTPTPREPTVTRVPTPRAPTTTGPRFAHGSSPSIASSFESAKTVMRPQALTHAQIRKLIASRMAMLQAGGTDLFTFLGVPYGATATQVRTAYLEIARYLKPERLAELGIHDDRDEARTVFAQAVIAMTTLTDDRRRADYLAARASARAT